MKRYLPTPMALHCKSSLRSWRDSRASDILRWSRYFFFFLGAAKPRVKFPPATFLMVFACRPHFITVDTSINKPIKESCNTKLEYLWFCGCTHQTFPSTSLSFSDLPFLYDIIGGILKIVFSGGRAWMRFLN